MVRANIFLVLVLMSLAFLLITTRYNSRQLYTSLDKLEAQAKELDSDWRLLQLSRAELTRSTRIDKIARNELGLISSSASDTIFLKGQP